MNKLNRGFRSCLNHGFQMIFENGLSISVRWASAAYCERQQFGNDYALDLKETHTTSADAEVSIFQDTVMMHWGNDCALGYATPDQVAQIIAVVQAAQPESDNKIELRRLGLIPEAHHRDRTLESVRLELVRLGFATEPPPQANDPDSQANDPDSWLFEEYREPGLD